MSKALIQTVINWMPGAPPKTEGAVIWLQKRTRIYQGIVIERMPGKWCLDIWFDTVGIDNALAWAPFVAEEGEDQ